MKASERLESMLNILKTLPEFRFVDLYWSQDQRESVSIPDFPAALINIRDLVPVEGNIRNFEMKPEFGILLYFDGLETNTSREYQALDIIEKVCFEITKNSRYEIISASCVERSPKLTVWSVEFRFRG